MKVAVIDYGLGNLGSVRRAIAELGAEPVLADKPEQLASADRVILPGVGSFADGMALLRERGWVGALRETGKPVLGICLGMQLLASRGTEGGDSEGLDLIPGEVVGLDKLGCELRIPHVGWNSVAVDDPGRILRGITSGTDFYFVHSYVFQPRDAADVVATTSYGVPVTAVVGRGNAMGTQFHPEKSSKAGFRV
ncbi:MAG TPA: imidazole glycerol phosphate synthase subunit HisH, partial [Burkholderiales bacterium]|nr:imidazole glycerol phosphate synthase subunit HisH [Burkholderiales bacterium]